MTGGQAIGGNWDVTGIVKQVSAEGVKRISILSENPSTYKHLETKGIKSLHRDSIITEQQALSEYEGVSVLVYDQTFENVLKSSKVIKNLHASYQRYNRNQYIQMY